MREEKALVALLRRIVDVIADESARNPEFASRLAAALEKSVPARSQRTPGHFKTQPPLPDIHAEWSARGEQDFRLWLREQPVLTIRALIRAQDLDPTRRTTKWKEPAKLADFLTDGLRNRLARGSAFMDRK